MFISRSSALLQFGCASIALCLPSSSTAESTAFQLKRSCSIEETFDSNVFLQSYAARAEQTSWVTTISPALSITATTSSEGDLVFSYNPSWTTFHAAKSEDFLAHRFQGSGHVKIAGATLTAAGTLSLIDGSDTGMIWTGPGGAPATGAPSVRDRRDQAVYRANVGAVWTPGLWTIRPSGTLYIADFQTVQRTTPGYQNYVDRNDLTLGLDATRKVAEKLSVGLGYRTGRQDQARLLNYPEEYDNRYQRVLAILEGKLAPWATVTVLGGPEFRHYGDRAPTTMGDRDVVNLYADCVVTVALSRNDSIALLVRQFEMLSSSGRGAFEDLNFDLSWRHTLSKRASVSTALHAYNTDFLKPAVRNDWVLSGRIAGTLDLDETWKVDFAITHERGYSKVPDTAGREFDRTVFYSAARCAF